MKIHCNSSEAMIHSSEASDFFEQIILELEIENKEHLFSLFKRVKAIERVSDEELNFLYDFLISNEFRKLYEEKISTFTWKKEKLKNLEYSNMISSFVCFMNKSKVIYILDLWADEISYEWKKYLKVNIWKKIRIETKKQRWKIDLNWDNDNFEKFRNRWKKILTPKFKYLEIINENSDYLIWIDLRSGLYLLIDKDTNEILLKSKEELSFINNNHVKHCFVIEWENNLFLIYWNSFINVSDETIVHFIWNDLFLINKKLNTVFKVWWKMNVLWEWEILEIKGNKITFFNSENHLTLIYDIWSAKFEIK